MNPEDIQQGLIDACKSVAQSRSLNPVLPGYEYASMPRPAIVFQYEPAERPAMTLKGAEIIQENGVFSASIVVEQGQGTAGAFDHAHAIAAAFGEGDRISITGGQIVIMKPAEVRGGYPDGANWRVPVVVNYSAAART